MTSAEEIKLAIHAAERKATRLRQAVRNLERLRAKYMAGKRLTEHDELVYDDALMTLNEYQLAVPSAYQHWAW